MDEARVTPLPITLVESPEHASTTWMMSDDNPSQQKPSADILAMPERLKEVPEWLRTPLYRFLRLKQRNWPAKTVQRSTRQLFNRLNHIITFFIQHFEWSEWQQLAPHWLEEYIDARLRCAKGNPEAQGVGYATTFTPSLSYRTGSPLGTRDSKGHYGS